MRFFILRGFPSDKIGDALQLCFERREDEFREEDTQMAVDHCNSYSVPQRSLRFRSHHGSVHTAFPWQSAQQNEASLIQLQA